MDDEVLYLYDHTEDTRTRFISFVGQTSRFDLAITSTDNFFGKKLVVSIQNGRAAIIGTDDLEEEGYIAHAFQLSEPEAAELTSFLEEVIA